MLNSHNFLFFVLSVTRFLRKILWLQNLMVTLKENQHIFSAAKFIVVSSFTAKVQRLLRILRSWWCCGRLWVDEERVCGHLLAVVWYVEFAETFCAVVESRLLERVVDEELKFAIVLLLNFIFVIWVVLVQNRIFLARISLACDRTGFIISGA